jgi:S1/P1 Nuclease
MHPTLHLALFACLSLIPGASSWAFGDGGHQAIWAVAQSQLTPAAKARVDGILAGDKLDMTPVWMDRVRDVAKGMDGPLKDDADAAAFNAKFKYNSTWHYVDLPLEAESYDSAREFHGYSNIVKQLNITVQVLLGQSAEMDERTALRVLTHLVGDIHQPMHCGSGYFDISNPQQAILRTKPEDCIPLEKAKCGDQGGNLLFFGPDKFDQLHAYWDTDVVKRAAPLGGLDKLITRHLNEVQADSPGNAEAWPAAWATEGVKQAAKAYQGLQFGACTLNTTNKRGKFTRIEVTLPADYPERSKTMAIEQLTKAAKRTASLLNAILK